MILFFDLNIQIYISINKQFVDREISSHGSWVEHMQIHGIIHGMQISTFNLITCVVAR